MTAGTAKAGPVYGWDREDEDLREAFTSGRIPVVVYGLGKMGLPLAAVFAEVTGNSIGVDVDPGVVRAVNDGESPVDGEPGLDGLVESTVGTGALHATTNGRNAANRGRIHVVVVPTLLDDDGTPDVSLVEVVLRELADGLSPGDLVVVESTVPPGSCERRFRPLLLEESGLDAGTFGLAFCPERTKSGRALTDIRGSHPKIVGGVDERSTRAAATIYDEITENEVVTTADATTAECVKVFEGVYRDVNIALANELGRHAAELGVDVTAAIDAANTQPFCDIHEPGAGVGGHCIPYYPRFLTASFETDAPLIRAARDVNEAMPLYTASTTLDGLAAVGCEPTSASVLLLGLTYAPEIDEIRETPALPIVDRLVDAGVDVVATDPVTDRWSPFEEAGATVLSPADAVQKRYDAVVLATAHDAFTSLDLPSLGVEDRPLVVVDGRQLFTQLRDRSDVHYLGVGVNV